MPLKEVYGLGESHGKITPDAEGHVRLRHLSLPLQASARLRANTNKAGHSSRGCPVANKIEAYSFLSAASAGADSLSTWACASASSIAFLASATFLARASAR